MKKKATQPKRSYLPKEDRRLALLDVAAQVVEQQGWPALSMISVAETAKVSRQLVYQHFESVDELMADTMAHLFRSGYEKIRQSIANPTNDLADLIRIADAQTFDDPPERVRALWQMLTATYSSNPETGHTGSRLRHLLMKLWSPTLAREFGLSDAHGRALAWMLNMAFWGAHQLVAERELSRKAATELFTWMVERLRQNGAAPRAPAPAAAVSRARRARAPTPTLPRKRGREVSQ